MTSIAQGNVLQQQKNQEELDNKSNQEAIQVAQPNTSLNASIRPH